MFLTISEEAIPVLDNGFHELRFSSFNLFSISSIWRYIDTENLKNNN